MIGDSLSAGYGIAAEQGWVHLLAERLDSQGYKHPVNNASVTGDTTHGGLIRLPRIIKRQQPAIVLIELGGNDGLRGFDLDTTRRNLQQMVQLVKAANATPILAGVRLPPNYGDEYRLAFENIFLEIGDIENIPVIPKLLNGVAEDRSLMQADGIHPSVDAQPVILDNVWPTIQAALGTG